MNIIEILTGMINSFWNISVQMAPWLLLGFIFAGVMYELIPESVMEKLAGKRGLGSIIKVSLLGIPLPICSCGIVPVSAALKKRGAGPGAVSAFLITTPQTGAESIAVTWSMLGWIFALFRVGAAFLTGIICGVAVEYFTPPHLDPDHQPEPEDCHKHEHHEETESCCSPKAEPEKKSCCSHEAESEKDSCCSEESGTEESCCSKSSCCSEGHGKSQNAIIKLFTYAFGELIEDLGNLLLIGLVVAAAIDVFIPKEFVTDFGDSPWAMLIMLAAGLPMYVCSTASVPIAATLMLKGISPGAALVFLVTGPATNAAALTALSKIIGKRALVIYLVTLVILSLACGFVLDLIPGVRTAAQEAMSHGEHGTNWIGIISAIFLYLIIARVWIKGLKQKLSS